MCGKRAGDARRELLAAGLNLKRNFDGTRHRERHYNRQLESAYRRDTLKANTTRDLRASVLLACFESDFVWDLNIRG
jgi:hypothetical protein